MENVVSSMGLLKYVLILNQHFSRTLLGKGGGGREKAYVLYARENAEKYGRALTMMAEPINFGFSVCIVPSDQKYVSSALD